MKVLNASRFALGRLTGEDGTLAVPSVEAASAPIDRAMLGRLALVVGEATAAFEDYDYARALERTEAFFWSFCDDYLELVKSRAYGDAADPGTVSARAALAGALSVLLRLLAPILPFVTEEVWSWWRAGSIHAAAWPTVGELGPGADRVGPDTDAVLEVSAEVLGLVRRAKTTAKRSMRAPVARLTVTGSAGRLAALAAAEGDVRDAGGVVELVTLVGDEPDVVVELAEE
jgi:valyl-tRNA synthetase